MLRKNHDVIWVIAFFALVFSYVMYFVPSADLGVHARLALKAYNESHLFAGNFIMYFLANLLSGFSGRLPSVTLALLFLAIVAITAKYLVTLHWLQGVTDRRTAKLGSLSLLVVYILPLYFFAQKLLGLPLPHRYYLGYFVPNVWHNTTIICSMPFVIAMYIVSLRMLRAFSWRDNGLLAVLTVLCVYVKPSFFFCFGVAYPLFLLWRYRLSATFMQALLPVLLGVTGVGLQYLSLYENASDGSAVYFDFASLLTAEFWQAQLPLLLSSLGLPIVFSACFWERCRHSVEYWFLLLMLAVAIGIDYICKESGPRAAHGNFYWQIVPVMWLLYAFMLRTALAIKPALRQWKGNGRLMTFGALWGLHLLAGVAYLLIILLTRGYY